MKKTSILAALLIFLSLSVAGLIAQNAQDLFQKALTKERAEGNLKEAISLYEKVIKTTKDESLAAQAQLRIGFCYEKLGMREAQKAFQKVIDNYPKQAEAVEVAKGKLSILLRAKATLEKAEKEFKIRKVCEGEDIDVSGEVSPDGRYISYTDWRTGDLAIYEISTGKKRRLTSPTEVEPFGMVLRSRWSSDSQRIAYNWYNKDSFWDLRIIGLDGPKHRVLYRDKDVFPLPLDWSPDGKHILAIFDNYYKDKVKQVGLISVTDGAVSILETFKGRAAYYYLCFSPDGRYIAYDYPQKQGSQDRDIFIYSIEEKSEIPLVQDLADDRLVVWTPDGKNILFGSNRLGTMDLWAISVKEGKPQGALTLVKKDIGLISPTGFAPDGSLYYGVSINIRDVYIGTLNKEREKFLVPPEKLTGPFVGNNFSPEWSPDGKSLAYISRRLPRYEYGADILYIVSLETGEEREVVRPQEIRSLGGISRGICWSPDGRSILSSGHDKKGQGIYVVDVKTGEMTAVLYGEEQIMNPNWSADGKAIFFIERDWKKGISRVFRYDMKTKEKKEIYNQSPNLLWLIPSPDGKLLAFATFEKYKEENIGVLMVLPVEGGEPREVVKIIGGACGAMAWALDSREIIYGIDLYAPGSQGMAQGSELWKVSVEGGEPQKLWKMASPLEELRIHPDGQRLAFSSSTNRAEIWVMENFLPESRKR